MLLLGDPMVLLRAVGGAECSGDIEAFCTDHGLRSKAVREVRKLRVQLTNETNSIRASTGVADIVVDPGMKPPIDSEAKLLRQIMLAGLPDHVARKIPMQEIKESEDRRKFKYAYRCPEMEDPVFLNPATILRNSAPEWIVYQDIYETDKMYVRGITAIDPQWLPVYAPTLCTFSDPLELPAPRYDSQRDQVRCHMNVTFGRSSWPLPLMELEFPVGIDRFKYFGQFFLSGAVCPPLAKNVKMLLSTPSTMIKSWAKLQPRTQVLLQELMKEKVDTLESLLTVWRTNNCYLLEAYKMWLPESLHEHVASQWPPL